MLIVSPYQWTPPSLSFRYLFLALAGTRNQVIGVDKWMLHGLLLPDLCDTPTAGYLRRTKQSCLRVLFPEKDDLPRDVELGLDGHGMADAGELVMDALEAESGRQEQANGSRLSCTAPIDSFETKQEGWVGNHQAVG